MQIDSLKNNIAKLQQLRNVYYSQLNASDLAELDNVLVQLTRLDEKKQRDAAIRANVLEWSLIVYQVVRIAIVIFDMLK